ncbi:MAG: GDSL-type esterase/lipase family protein [Brevundimonas sp.]|uniref:GDSL-type esterase/lipase family protein n=1 Tax=Brevundimonas sp. TaxID=1871086 RepID=UPI002488CC95|nr:GDSL-type esterase/lipase family protein [Brevundimonas sp.]MDI1326055.1 GDSL-type esterase/lipase family protein [Brevundimonas sp.]
MATTAAALSAGLWAAGLWIAASGAGLAQEIPYTAVAAPPAGESDCPGGLCQAEGLSGVFEALAATEAGQRTRPVHILQIGDSHTAGDRITGKLRADLQARFGAAGRGVLPPGPPYDNYAPYQVRMAAAGWVAESPTLQPSAGTPSTRVGLAGMRTTGGEGALIGFELDPGAEASVVGVCGRARGPGAGLSVEAGGMARGLDFNGTTPDQEVCRELALPGPTASVRLVPLERGVVMDSVMLSGGRPGAMVSSLGVIGATLRDLASRDEAIAAAELAMWRPSLIVLAFGTNEGFDDALHGRAYEALLREQIARMRRLAPAASLMLLGAPDALRSGVAGGCSADGQRAPPPSLAVVRDVQRRVAADMGVAFWDWRGRMGGECSADRLALRDDPFMRGDRVHFTNTGADWIGGVLSRDLLAAYDGWKAARVTPAGEPQ